jgi:hypothetical protein
MSTLEAGSEAEHVGHRHIKDAGVVTPVTEVLELAVLSNQLGVPGMPAFGGHLGMGAGYQGGFIPFGGRETPPVVATLVSDAVE